MSITFALKGGKARTFHGSHSRTPLSISGTWQFSGPQPVDDDGGVPQWVADLFDRMPDLKRIALGTETGGVVWSRRSEDATKDAA